MAITTEESQHPDLDHLTATKFGFSAVARRQRASRRWRIRPRGDQRYRIPITIASRSRTRFCWRRCRCRAPRGHRAPAPGSGASARPSARGGDRRGWLRGKCCGRKWKAVPCACGAWGAGGNASGGSEPSSPPASAAWVASRVESSMMQPATEGTMNMLYRFHSLLNRDVFGGGCGTSE